MEAHFPAVCARFPEFLRLRGMLAARSNEWAVARDCEAKLEALAIGDKAQLRAARLIRRYLVWGMPLKTRLRYIWKNRRMIPAKLKFMARRLRARIPGLA
jgi:hypothetical protein